MQRRASGRYRIWLLVQLNSGELRDAMAVTHNVSQRGMLIALSARLEVGAEIEVSCRLPSGRQLDRLRGRIVRIEPNLEDPEGLWPYRVGIAFDDLAPELLTLLESSRGERDSLTPVPA